MTDETAKLPAIDDVEYVRPLQHGGWALSDLAAADIAVASKWIEDAPEARAAYLAESEDEA